MADDWNRKLTRLRLRIGLGLALAFLVLLLIALGLKTFVDHERDLNLVAYTAIFSIIVAFYWYRIKNRL